MEEEPVQREVTTEWSAALRWLPLQATVKRTVTQRYERRSEQFIKDVEVYAGVDRERIADRIDADEVFADAYLEAGDKAAHSADAEFRTALARLVAAGLRADVEVDEVAFWVTIMRRLEPAHLRYLDARRRAEDMTAGKRVVFRPGPYTVEDVALSAGMPIGVGHAAADYLVQLGLMQGSRIADDTLYTVDTTAAGRALLKLCSELEEPPDAAGD